LQKKPASNRILGRTTRSRSKNYIAANGLSGFTEDPTLDGAGTTGMQYKIITPSTRTGADSIKYSDKISLVYTIKSFDGKYTSVDTINNHLYDFLGYLTKDNLPQGLQLAIHNLLQYKGASMRVLIPSRLAYGINGTGSGSSSNVNSRIAGNQCLDYYVHVIDNQDIYDDKVINNYIAANNLSGFVKDFALIDSAGIQVKKYYYYKTVTVGTGNIGDIKEFSNVTTTYGGSILNGFSFDFASYTTPTVLVPFNLIDGVSDALQKHATKGTSLQMFLPSSLGYGTAAQTGIPANSVLRFDFSVSGIDL
jgi:FKBP-type peptidyl-prolyl cis-trans isomerase FkpA